MDVDIFVEEFFRRCIGAGKACSAAGIAALMSELPAGKQVEIVEKIEARQGFKQRRDLVSGESRPGRRGRDIRDEERGE